MDRRVTFAARPRASIARRIQYPRATRAAERWWDLFPLDLGGWPIDMDQDTYVEILFSELGFAPGARRAWLRAGYGGRERLQELSWPEKSKLIDRLKAQKQAQRELKELKAARDESACGNLFEWAE